MLLFESILSINNTDERAFKVYKRENGYTALCIADDSGESENLIFSRDYVTFQGAMSRVLDAIACYSSNIWAEE